MAIKSLSDITHAYYINLEHRTDRDAHVKKQLDNVGINAQRFNAIKMKYGHIGCSMSHLKILQDAQKNNWDHILIIEDDITFLNPTLFKTQINKFFDLHQNDWDVILLAGNNMPPHKEIDNTCIQVTRCQTTTGYLVNGHYINTLIQNVKMGLTHLLSNPDDKFNYAIDKFWLKLQSQHKWFLIVPATVIQKQDYSDIEQKVTNYEKLMQDIDKTEMLAAIKEKQMREMLIKQFTR